MGWWGRNRTKLQHVAERRKSSGSEGEIFKWNVISTRNETKLTLAHKPNQPKQKKKTSDWDVRMALPPVGCTNKIRKKSNKQHKIAIVSNFPVQRSRKWSQLAPSSSIQHLVNKFQKKLIHIICFEKRKTNSEDGST